MEEKEIAKSDGWAIALIGAVILCLFVLFWVGSGLSTLSIELGIKTAELPIALRVILVVMGLTLEVFLIYGGIGFIMALIGVLLHAFSKPLFERYRVFMVEKPHILFKGYRKFINSLR
jgi:hypothetical protein